MSRGIEGCGFLPLIVEGGAFRLFGIVGREEGGGGREGQWIWHCVSGGFGLRWVEWWVLVWWYHGFRGGGRIRRLGGGAVWRGGGWWGYGGGLRGGGR